MNDSLDPILQQEEQRKLRKQLIWRLSIAVVLVACVLGTLAWLEHKPNQAATITRDSSVRIAPRATTTPELAPATTASSPESVIASTPEAEISSTPTPEPSASPTPNASVTAFTGLPAEPYLPAVPKSSLAATATPIPLAIEIDKTIKQPTSSQSKVVLAQPYPRPVSSNSGYTVQAGVFLHASNAENMLRQVQSAGIPAYLETRVQIGPFKSQQEADAAVKKLRKLGLEPVIKAN